MATFTLPAPSSLFSPLSSLVGTAMFSVYGEVEWVIYGYVAKSVGMEPVQKGNAPSAVELRLASTTTSAL